MKKVVVTGITGFIGSHIGVELLNRGYAVRGTMRDLTKASHIRSVIEKHAPTTHLELVEADLLNLSDWKAVMQDVDYVQHVASPFPRTIPKRDDDLVKPAVDGTLHVLQAALRAGVTKTIVTSSIAAVLYGKKNMYRDSTYDEETWTDHEVIADTTAYIRSKTLAERVAWNFYENECYGKDKMQVSTVLPGAVLGPILEDDYGTSAEIILKMMNGSLPMIPRIGFEIVDVRDVADLHIKAMESPHADGQRILATAGYTTMASMAQTLRQAFPDRKIPSRLLPNWLMRTLGLVDGSVRQATIEIGAERKANSAKARNLLDWQPRSPKEAIITCADSLINQGIVGE
jgi:dihydroflavonol-4-reductase